MAKGIQLADAIMVLNQLAGDGGLSGVSLTTRVLKVEEEAEERVREMQ